MNSGILVMTGGSSGLGRVAAQRLLEAGATLWVAGRSAPPEGAVWLEADLSSLAGAEALAAQVRERAEGRRVQALVLNAGGFAAGRSPEGYDRVFVLNYLAHYLLVERLWDLLAEGGRVLLTTSGTHDPAEGSRVPAPKHANARRLAQPELDPERDEDPRTAASRAYAAAKLCVVLRARALAAREDARGLKVLAYDPGPTPGTGLARGLPAPMRLLWMRLRWLMRDKANTVEDAGEALARLALGQVSAPEGGVYVALRRGALTWPALSVHARQDGLVEALEVDSAGLVERR